MRRTRSLRRHTAVALGIATAAALSTVPAGPANALTGPITFGNPGDVPIIGNWFGRDPQYEGAYEDEIGVYRPSNSRFYFYRGRGDVSFGNPGDIPIIGDWDGDGRDDVGVYRPSNGRFYREGPFSSAGQAFGNVGDIPITGDWDRDGITEIGVYRTSNHTFYPDLQA